jgi:hypothetical protein
MKITKELILMLGFVIQDKNPAGFVFTHPKNSMINFVFWEKFKAVIIQHTVVEFATLEHFIISYQTLTLSKLRGVKVKNAGDRVSVSIQISDLQPKHINIGVGIVDPNTKFCLNQNKDA